MGIFIFAAGTNVQTILLLELDIHRILLTMNLLNMLVETTLRLELFVAVRALLLRIFWELRTVSLGIARAFELICRHRLTFGLIYITVRAFIFLFFHLLVDLTLFELFLEFWRARMLLTRRNIGLRRLIYLVFIVFGVHD